MTRKRPTWVTAVCVAGTIFGLLGLVGAYILASSGSTVLEVVKEGEESGLERTSNVPLWVYEAFVAVGRAGYAISLLYILSSICLLTLKRWALRFFYLAISLSVGLAVAKTFILAAEVPGLFVAAMKTSLGILMDVALLIVVVVSDKSVFGLGSTLPDLGSRSPELAERGVPSRAKYRAFTGTIALIMNGIWMLLWLWIFQRIVVNLMEMEVAEEIQYGELLVLLSIIIVPTVTVLVFLWGLRKTPPSALRFSAIGLNALTALFLFGHYATLMKGPSHPVAFAIVEGGSSALLGILAAINVVALIICFAKPRQ